MAYEIVKIVHILGASVLFGTGLGIAFFMFMAYRSMNVAALAVTGSHVVLADFLFTAVAVIVQPITGAILVSLQGYSWMDLWVWASLALYVFVGLCWLPVVWLQIRMKDMAIETAQSGEGLDPRYHRYFRMWFILGWPAFLAVIGIFTLMVFRPV